MKIIWYLSSAVMIANGLVMALLLRNYLTGGAFIAIGLGFIFLRRYRIQRDRNRLQRDIDQTFE